MPEGHTLHRLARSQRRQFVGLPIAVSSPQGRFDGTLVDGRVLDSVTAHGKHLFASFGDRIVHVHLGLFGKYAAGAGDPPEPKGAIRMRWVAESGWADLRGPTACEVLSPSEVDAIIARLGPDPLRAGSDGGRAFERIRRSRAPLAGLLMDQRVVAGVGNVYRSEVLFRHRLDPYLPGKALDAAAWERIWSDVVTLMRAGLRSGRIITTDPVDRTRRTGPVRGEDAHYVYRRTGMPCRIDGTPITMQVLAARKLYWCPTCQGT